MIKFSLRAMCAASAAVLGLMGAHPAFAQIRIGQSTGLTGPVALSVAEINVGAKLYIDSINEDGGVGGQQIELVSLDDKNQVEIAAQNAKQLVSDPKVVALFLTRGTPHAQATLPILAEGRIVLLAPSTGAMVLHKPVQPYVFNVRATYQREAEHVVRHLGMAGMEQVAICYVDDSFGADALQGALKVFKETQKAPSFSLPVDKFKPDYRACVQQMQAKKPLGLLLIGTPVSVSAGINAVRAAGSKATIATLSNNAATGFVQALKDNAAGIVVSQVFPSERSLKSPMIAEAARLAAAKGVKKPLTPAMIEGFAAAKVLVVALKRASKEREGVTRGSIKRALESFNRVDIGAGAGAEISFSSSDHTGLDYVDLSIIGEDGSFRR